MLSKREYKRKRKEEQEAAAHVFQDFIETFQNPSGSIANKTFVRSGTLYPDSQEQINENVCKIYKPKPLISHTQQNDSNKAIECAKILKDNVLDKTKKREKPKSNLDLLKEELKLRHAERGEREKLKEEFSLSPALSSMEGDEQGTTNLFVANLKTTVTENNLMLEFGAYGPLASVKILWPRGDDANRSTNCGFVAFMSRKDAERALNENQYRDDMRVCWGRSVELPSFPVYVPNSLLKLYLPPPLSGLPFNAQPPPNILQTDNNIIPKCCVKVTIPFNKKILMLIHRMIEFVVTEGPMFEAFIMNQEINNPDYNFLFDCQSSTHVYYRWKLFSILNGDSQNSWSMKKFRMFKGGSIWCPPIAPCYTAGMPDELLGSKNPDKNKLSGAQCDRLIIIIKNLTMERSKISEAMTFCMNHLDAIDDSIEIIIDSLMNPETAAPKKVARLYLLSDILSNCKSKRIKLHIEKQREKMINIFKLFQSTAECLNIGDKDNFIPRILRVIRYWDIHKIFLEECLQKLNDIVSINKPIKCDDDNSSIDEPLDGANLLKRSCNESLDPNVITAENLNVKKVEKFSSTDMTKYFVPSKWDTIDPEEVEAQAMSTEKIYLMEIDKYNNVDDLKKDKTGASTSSKKKKKKSKR